MELEFERLSTGPLMLIAVAAIAVLLILILAVKMHALMALVIVSVGTAIATRIPLADIMDVILGGFGETLGEIALLIAFGVMFARLLETSGGSMALSNFLIDKLGEKRAPLALGIASLLFGLPIFFDAAFMVMLPLYLAVARRLGGSMLMYVLPPAAALSTMHVFMPPHPGVVTAGVLLGADVGLVMLLGLIIAIPTWLIAGMLYGTFIGKRIVLPIPDLIAGGPMIDDDSQGAQNPPKVITLLGLLLLPLVLIFGNLLATTTRQNRRGRQGRHLGGRAATHRLHPHRVADHRARLGLAAGPAPRPHPRGSRGSARQVAQADRLGPVGHRRRRHVQRRAHDQRDR